MLAFAIYCAAASVLLLAACWHKDRFGGAGREAARRARIDAQLALVASYSCQHVPVCVLAFPTTTTGR